MSFNAKSLSDIMSKVTRTSKKRILWDIHAVGKAQKAREISNIGFLRASENISDALIKKQTQNELFELFKTGKHTINCEQ